ncbi:transcriptional regulator [Bacillus sp. Sa1BUA2]|uniref:Transcriptional regulator n=2 Tax=Bacillus norwichensis TaxID=2762217 RepID=A0ABR8VML0_9BACI|nr:transcriptional regulator [Bacillus norwichensis]MBD8006004.1 transcriptional regulator [Bacillus norwichensis]
MDSETLLALVLLSPILLTQSILLFIDAKKKGAYAWFWGLWGLIQLPCPSIFYYFIIIRSYRKKMKL